MVNLLKTQELNLSCTCSLFFFFKLQVHKSVYPTFQDRTTHPEIQFCECGM